jgi:hypothetical protein
MINSKRSERLSWDTLFRILALAAISADAPRCPSQTPNKYALFPALE